MSAGDVRPNFVADLSTDLLELFIVGKYARSAGKPIVLFCGTSAWACSAIYNYSRNYKMHINYFAQTRQPSFSAVKRRLSQTLWIDESIQILLVMLADGNMNSVDADLSFTDGNNLVDRDDERFVNTDKFVPSKLFLDSFHAETRDDGSRCVHREDLDVVL